MSMSSDDPFPMHPQSLIPWSLWLWFGASSQLSKLRTSAGITSHFEACGTASRLAESMGGPVSEKMASKLACFERAFPLDTVRMRVRAYYKIRDFVGAHYSQCRTYTLQGFRIEGRAILKRNPSHYCNLWVM